MSQILFSTDFVDYLKTTDKTHFSVDVALNLFQRYEWITIIVGLMVYIIG